MRKAVKRCKKYWLHIIVFLVLLILLFVLISEKASENNNIKEEDAAGHVSIAIIGEEQQEAGVAEEVSR